MLATVRPASALGATRARSWQTPMNNVMECLLQEPGAKQVITFPRQLGNSLRKPDERRKKQRESHAQNKTAAKQEAEAEVKRLKNLKKQQLQER